MTDYVSMSVGHLFHVLLTVYNDQRGTLDQEDPDMCESGRKILPTQSHMGPRDFWVTCSVAL